MDNDNNDSDVATKDIICCNCGTLFSMESILDDLRRKDGKTFWCPNGHGQSYTNAPDKKIETLESELEEAQIEIRQLKCELLRLRKGGILSNLFNRKN